MQDAPDAREFVCGGCALEFDRVSFGYSPESMVLRDVSFKVEAGQTVALVGATGSGKSTALRLIFRYQHCFTSSHHSCPRKAMFHSFPSTHSHVAPGLFVVCAVLSPY